MRLMEKLQGRYRDILKALVDEKIQMIIVGIDNKAPRWKKKRVNY